jgi:hypothetical protein
MRALNRISNRPGIWRGKALLRLLLMLVAAAAVAAFLASFGFSRDYAHLRALLLSGAPGGAYHTIATRLATRAKQGHGSLIVAPTAGSVENVTRLTEGGQHCAAAFALVQDGIPVPVDAKLELLGRLPSPSPCCFSGSRIASFSPSPISGENRSGSVPKARGPPISCVSSLTTQTYGGWISGSLTTNWPSKRDWSAKENSILLPS